MFECIKNCFYKKPMVTDMKLEDFISESLVQICNGVKSAQDIIIKSPIDKQNEKYFIPYINPMPNGGLKNDIHEIQFDIAFTISSSKATASESKIKADIYVIGASIDLNGQKATNQLNSSVNKMKFSIPIIYPSMPYNNH